MLLSICIPTYNRAEYLREALENITSDPAFDDRVEVVISDNASPDHTREVGEEFADRFPNVRYFRNERNLVDENFEIVLRHGRGKYLKLFNDTLRLRPHSLAKILAIIEKESDEYPLYFYQCTYNRSSNYFSCSSPEAFMDVTSYWVTWIANFGLWRRYIDITLNSKAIAHLQFTQTIWSLQMAKGRESHIYVEELYDTVWPKKKGGYNFFETFTDKYFDTLKLCGIRGKALQKAKYVLFRYFLIGNIDQYLIRKEDTGFNLKGSWLRIFRHYWYNPYCYAIVAYKYLKALKPAPKIS